MQEHGLGPNGGLLYCIEYLEANYDWLEDRLRALGKDAYVLFDLPGQVELSTNHESLKNIVGKLAKSGFRVRSTALGRRGAHCEQRTVVGCGTPVRRPLCHRRREIYIRAPAFPPHDAPSRTPAR
jgi:hypothetical protein